jgi:hypothetical protein
MLPYRGNKAINMPIYPARAGTVIYENIYGFWYTGGKIYFLRFTILLEGAAKNGQNQLIAIWLREFM